MWCGTDFQSGVFNFDGEVTILSPQTGLLMIKNEFYSTKPHYRNEKNGSINESIKKSSAQQIQTKSKMNFKALGT